MSGLLLSGCCNPCAGGGACVTHRDEWESYYNLLRYQLADTPGGSTPVALVGWEPYPSPPGRYVELEGEGSFTIDIAAPTGELMVGAAIYTLGVGASAGVTIRRADSSDNISLWWLGGTSWELRQGSTVLESISHAGSGEFRLILKTPLAGTTDVEVWLPHAMTGLPELVHTESAVAFVAPSELWHVGLIVDGEAAFDYLESSPCPKIIDCEPPGGCLATVGAEVPPVVPVVWTMSVPAIGNDGMGFSDCTPFGDDDFALVRIENVVGYDYATTKQWEWALATFDPFGTILGNGDPDIIGPTCGWLAVIPSFDHRVFECSGEIPPAVPAGKIPVRWTECAFGSDSSNTPTAAGKQGNTWLLGIQWRNVGTEVAPDMEYRVVMEMHTPFGTIGDYIGAWVKYDAADVIGGSFVLSNTYTFGCTLPATITVTAGGQDEIARRVLECWDTACEPPVTPQPGTCYLLNIDLVDADGFPWRMVANLGVNFDEATGSWYWEGGVSPHPLADDHDTCGPMQFGFAKIHCIEPGEGIAKTWVLDVTYDGQTERFVMSDDPELGLVWEGTTDIICSGQTWDFFAWGLHAPTGTYQFGSCEWSVCHDPMLYIIPAAFSTECDGGAGYTQHHGYLTFVPTSPMPWMTAPSGTVFYSPLPYGYPGPAGGIFLYVESGTVRLQIVDGQLEPLQDLFASVGYTCDGTNGNRPIIDDTSPISYLWGFPSPVTSDPFGICSGTTGFGSWSVSF